MTFAGIGLRRSGKPLLKNVLMQNVRDQLTLQALLFPLRRRLLLVRGLLRKSRTPWLPLLPPPPLQEGGRCLRMHLVLLPVGLPLIPLDMCPARGVEVLLDARPLCASALLSPLLLRGLRMRRQLARSGRLLLALPLPRLPLHAL